MINFLLVLLIRSVVTAHVHGRAGFCVLCGSPARARVQNGGLLGLVII